MLCEDMQLMYFITMLCEHVAVWRGLSWYDHHVHIELLGC